MEKVKLEYLLLGLALIIGTSLNAQPEGRGKPHHKPAPECNIAGFGTSVESIEQLDEGCIKYVLRVTTDGTVRYDLSHYTVAIPCGTVQNISNSRNWDQEVGKDPTTGLTGFKIDNIPTFGKIAGDSFTVEFIICGNDECSELSIKVAYKAGQCVDYETLEIDNGDDDDDGGDGDDDHDDNGGGGDHGDDDDDDDDDHDQDDGGNDDDDDGNTGGNDSTTCSTLLATIAKSDITCKGAANGTLSVGIQDGNQPITFHWSNGATDQSLQNLAAGVYAVTVTDADGNTLTLTETISEPESLSAEGTIGDPACSASLDGSISLAVAGGTGVYSYLWSNGATTKDISGLSAGTYSVTITDEAGCTLQKSFQLVNTVSINLVGIPTKTACAQSTGAIDLTVSGGTAPYTYVWSNGATTEDLQNLAAGSYRVVVTDANGCQSIGTYFVQAINDIRVTFQATKTNCNNDPVGAIDITVTGGVAPYTYQWQHGPTTEDVTGLIAGTYRVTVTDQVGCATLTAILVQRETLQVNAQVLQPTCADNPTGSIQLTPTNGTGTYTYEWSNGETGNTLVDVPVGDYIVKVTDTGTGCSTTLSLKVSAPPAIVVDASVSNSACGEEGSYAISLAVSGGRLPYQILWSNGLTGPSISGLSSGTYLAQIKDVNGCIVNKEVVVGTDLFAWQCVINQIVGTPTCNSVGNSISSSVSDADNYSWTIESSDNSWVITAGQNLPTAIFSVGNPGSNATFTLLLEKGGCQKTCSYQLTNGCEVKDNTGGGDPANGDPCASPTPPAEEDPQVPPVEEDESDDGEDKDDGESDPKLCAYPNPFVDKVSFKWKAIHDDYVKIEVYDQHGRMMKRVFEDRVNKGEDYSADWQCDDSQRGLFFYRYVSGHHHMKGKVMRK